MAPAGKTDGMLLLRTYRLFHRYADQNLALSQGGAPLIADSRVMGRIDRLEVRANRLFLEYLHALPVDCLKIDGVFVNGMLHRTVDLASEEDKREPVGCRAMGDLVLEKLGAT